MQLLPLSFSSIETFRQCPGKFRFKILNPTIRKPKTPELELGTAIHEEIEAWINGTITDYDKTPEPMTVWALDQVLEYAWEGNRPIAPQAECSWGLDSEWNPVEFESPVAMLHGVIDCLLVGEKSVTILEWKTGKSGNHKWRQVDLYRLAMSRFFPSKFITANVFYLNEKCTKLQASRRSLASFANVAADFSAVIQQILSLDFDNPELWPCKPGGLCSWCDFDQGICPAVGPGIPKTS